MEESSKEETRVTSMEEIAKLDWSFKKIRIEISKNSPVLARCETEVPVVETQARVIPDLVYRFARAAEHQIRREVLDYEADFIVCVTEQENNTEHRFHAKRSGLSLEIFDVDSDIDTPVEIEEFSLIRMWSFSESNIIGTP